MPYRTPDAPPPEPAPPPISPLGALRSIHEPALRAYIVVAAIAVGLILLMGAVLAISFGAAVFAIVTPVAGVAALLTLPALRLRGVRVDLYARGVVVLRGDQRDQVLFEDVDELWLELDGVQRQARIRSLKLIDHDGAVHRIPALMKDAVPLVRWIERHCSDPLFHEAKRALDAGEVLTFGKVQVTRESLTIGRASVPWRSLRVVRMQLGRIAFFRWQPVFPWRMVTLDSIPHPAVFARLVREAAPRIEVDLPWGMRVE
jgi:hypothetical protein